MLISVQMTRTATQQVAAGYNYPAKTLSFQWHGMAVEETEYCCSFNHRGWNSSIVIRFIWRGKPNVGTVETTAESPADQRRQWSYGEDSTCRLQQTYETSAQDTEDTLASLTEQLNQPDIELMLVNTLFQKANVFTTAVVGPLWDDAMKLFSILKT